jgi:proline dehydrogenase
MQLGAARFVAGETLDECVAVLRRLNDQGLYANTTLLGEDVSSADEARAVAEEYETILARLHAEKLRANVALKLTHLGLDLGTEVAFDNVHRLVERAAELGNFIRIDMQPNLRLGKGAYLEPPDVAYPDKRDVDAAYVRLVERSLRESGYTAIATHDRGLIEHAIAFTEEQGIGRDRFEFQMLYGVRPQLQLDLAGRGFKVLVATPFGPEWFPYLMRRLAERPANLTFFARNAFRR